MIIYCKILYKLYVSNLKKTYTGGTKLNSIVIVKWIFFLFKQVLDNTSMLQVG